MERIGVFLGAASGHRESYRQATAHFGRTLAGRGLELVYGGGGQGLMGTLADAVLASGGRVVGVIPNALVAREMAHAGLQDLRLVDDMLERKRIMLERSDAFVGLPGGYGTLDEVFEALTATQIGTFQKPCGLLNVDGFYDPLLAWVDRAVADGLIRPTARRLLVSSDSADDLLDQLLAWESPGLVPLK